MACPASLKNPFKALVRDLNYLIAFTALASSPIKDSKELEISIVLEWPTRITQTEFFKRASEMFKGKVHGFLSR